MKIFIKLSLMFLMLFLSLNSQAVIVTHVADIKRAGGIYNLRGYIDSWDENDNLPNPCFGVPSSTDCELRVVFYDLVTKQYANVSSSLFIGGVNNIKTIGELGTRFKQRFSIPLELIFVILANEDPTTKCFSLALYTQGTLFSPVEGVKCATSPPDTLTCEIQGNANLEHGEMTTNEVNGHKANTKFDISCNNDATLFLKAYGEAGSKNITLKSDKSLESAIYINDVRSDAGLKINIKKNIPAAIQITSELIKNGELEEGAFHGSGIFIISMD
ncbi:MrpH family fimbial adhesin [Candidatus Pantoea floridensis]|uniref:Fimbrial adhesin MrpH C-terminal domain-containing protein n=1 Tax=Candidatus Pantoea floridensis TaxID=1938870 RepID=A0A286BTN5_9GAMM|nr:hypothetical protein [Pantoea floridensis]PIF24072.1 hypothetical protein BX596_3563 [Enterobacteriaceae bacterium JKS000233]SOD37525.1 hypothetical protein SAMN06273570_1885 [Pantoea floridensis]